MENPLTRIISGGRKSARLSPDGLRITEFPPPVVRMLRLYGLSGSYEQIFASQPNVRTIVDDLSNEAAELALKMYMRDPRGPLLADARIEVDHPMMELLGEPQPKVSPRRLWKGTFADIEIFDIAFWRMVGSPPKALVRIPPNAITPQRDASGHITEWRAWTGERIKPEELIIYWGYDPAINDGYIPPIETIRRILAEDLASGQDREHRWSNALRKDGVIEQDVDAPRMSDEARESFLTDAEIALSGQQNSYTPFMLEPGMRFRDTEWSPKEMDYLNARKLNRVEVAAMYHYPANKVLAGNADPNAETQAYFYSSTLPPRLSRVEAEIMAQLLPQFELIKKLRMTFYVEFNLDAKMRGSFEQQAAVMATTAGGPVVLVNEARARLNLPPIEGGDQIFIPLNSMRGGGPQGSPQAPVDTPAQGLNPAGTTPTPLPGGGNAPALPSGTASLSPAQIKEVLSPSATDETIEAILAKHDVKMAHAKASGDLIAFMREARARFEERHAKMFEKFFARQLNAFKGGKTDFDSKRWLKELAADLFGVSLQTVEHVGKNTAKSLEGDWSTERTQNYLQVSAEKTAEAINNSTVERISSTEPEEIPDTVFGEGRVKELSTSNTTFSMNWAVSEAAHQNEPEDDGLKKTWLVTSDNPRETHAALNGVAVPYSETFANGLRFPGDGSTGNADETAGCTCVMSVSV